MRSDEVFEPSWASPPGYTIADVLQRKGLDKETLADAAGERLEIIEDLLAGRAKVTKKIAQTLAEHLGASETFWLDRESQYQDDLTRRRLLVDDDITGWLSEIPVTELINLQWVPAVKRPADRLDAILAYFGVDSVTSWRDSYRGLASAVSFRTSPVFGSHLGAVLAWLRRGQILSEGQTTRPLSVPHLKRLLPQMRALTREKSTEKFVPALRALCNEAGVALAVVATPKRCRASGATWITNTGTGMCLLSYRYKTDDQFWFTFFHEMGHLVLHSERSLFLEDGDEIRTSDEAEANDFAGRILIPDEWRASLESADKSHKGVIRLAREIGVSPGIVVGQMQHSGLLPVTWLNKLKRRLDWPSSP